MFEIFCSTLDSLEQLESFDFCSFLFCCLFDFKLAGWIVAAEPDDWLVVPSFMVGFDKVGLLIAVDWVLLSCLVGFDRLG